MTDNKAAKTNIVVLLAILALSAITMMWLSWRYPVVTGIITLLLMLGFGFSARTARSIDVDMNELDHTEHPAG